MGCPEEVQEGLLLPPHSEVVNYATGQVIVTIGVHIGYLTLGSLTSSCWINLACWADLIQVNRERPPCVLTMEVTACRFTSVMSLFIFQIDRSQHYQAGFPVNHS